ncbi:hypothetical protein, partial [Bizionia paragorgiae]
MKHSISLSLICLVLLTSCTYFQNKKAEKQMQNYTAYKDLHQHQGTENYEVITLFKNDFILNEKLIDNNQNILSLLGENEKDISRKKIDFFGDTIGSEELWYRTLKDGTLWTSKHYLSWLFNGDNTQHKFIDPLTNNKIEDAFKFKNTEKDFKKWFKKFQEIYLLASYAYIYNSRYYFKINNIWYMMRADYYNEEPSNFRSQYPEKINPEEIRMQPLQESMETLMKQNIIKVIDYVQM